MKTYSERELANMTREEAKRILGNAVYDASRLLELLERAGKISGNGHHARQKLAALAEDEVARRWRED